MAAPTYTIDDLAQRSGVGPRTLRNWIRMRLLPRPKGLGRGARYDARHMLRAELIGHLRESGLSMQDVRSRLASMNDAHIEALLAKQPRRTQGTSVPKPPPPPQLPSVPCEVVELMDGLSLMLDGRKGELVRRVAAEIYRHYSIHPSRST